MSKKALIIGLDTYQSDDIEDLSWAVSDAAAIYKLLVEHQDKTQNYECKVLRDKMEDESPITRAALRKTCTDFFSEKNEQSLLYFSGHAILTPFGGHLCTSDTMPNDWGIPMAEIMQMTVHSKAQDILLILDCCHSGDMGNPSIFNTGDNPLALLKENTTIIAASRFNQEAIEEGDHGMFTAAVLDALEGGAADHMGWVTAPSIYAYIERRFIGASHRPIYKSHASQINFIRQCAPLIDRLKLLELVGHFPSVDYKYELDPEFEPEDEFGDCREPVNHEKVAIAQLFKDYRDSGLLKPSTLGEQLFWTARHSHSVELTNRGREYWYLVKSGILK
jgi:Caspase domain